MKFDSDNPVIIEFKRYGKCPHNALIVDTDLEKVECKQCGEKLNPFFAVQQMMKLSERWQRQKAELDLAREQAEKKTRTKCGHCGKMTEIRTNVTMQMVWNRLRDQK